jgi:hypothetical protein
MIARPNPFFFQNRAIWIMSNNVVMVYNIHVLLSSTAEKYQVPAGWSFGRRTLGLIK